MPLNIDWQQILLHWMNLAILTGGLYFILYKPVKQFMSKREEYYRELDRRAEEKLSQANQAHETYRPSWIKPMRGFVRPGPRLSWRRSSPSRSSWPRPRIRHSILSPSPAWRRSTAGIRS